MSPKLQFSAPAAEKTAADGNYPDDKFPISGYMEKHEHFYDLAKFKEPVYRHMARALAYLTNKSSGYAEHEKVPYESALTFDKFFEQLCERVDKATWTEDKEFYVVAYYSTLDHKLSPENQKLLAQLDEEAFIEALLSNALLKYWYGRPDLRNLATCIWTSRAEAVKASLGPKHKAAMEEQSMYMDVVLKRFVLKIKAGLAGWSLEEIVEEINPPAI